MSTVQFHEEAEAELISAARFYEAQREGLGGEFLMSVSRTYGRLADLPEAGAPFGRRMRRILVPKFPYGLIYRVEAARLFVVAVAHTSRRPGYWRSRV